MKKLQVNFEQRVHSSTVDVSIASLCVTDNSGDQRFQSIFENRPTQGQSELVTVRLHQRSKLSPDYKDVATELIVGFGGLVAYWKPQCIIYLVQFLNAQDLRAQSKDKHHSQPVNKVALEESIESDLIESKKQKSCLEKTEIALKVNLRLSYMQVIFIHPENHTYPVFSLELKQLGMGYQKQCDHETISIQVQNFQILDNTDYPKTLDPFVQYSPADQIIQNEIMGVKQTDDSQQMLDLNLVLFTYPGDSGCCPLQPGKQYNSSVQVTIRQARIVFMNERTLRIIDYIVNQVSNLIIINTADNIRVKQPDSLVQKQNKSLQEAYVKIGSANVATNQMTMKQIGNFMLWKNFDLNQQTQGPFLDITIRSPVIVVPNLKSDHEYFLLDLGTVEITSKVYSKPGRWVNFPKKELFQTSILLTNREARLDFVGKDREDNVFKEDKIEIEINTVNGSPFILDDWEEEERILQSRPAVFDLTQLDVSVKIVISLKIFKVVFQQATFISFFDMLNNNVIFKDKYSEHFSASLISQADSLEKKTYIPPYHESRPDKMMVDLRVKANCLSLEMRDLKNELISEVCIVGFDFQFEEFRSKRQMIYLYAGTMFMFHDEVNQVKQVMMGHLDAMAEVETDRAFYEQMPSEFIKIYEEQKDKINFKLSIQICPDGDLDMFLELTKVKLYARQEIILKVSKYFIAALERLDSSYAPSTNQTKEKHSSQKIQIHLEDTLVILENAEVSRRCVVLQTSMDVLIKKSDQRLMRQILCLGESKTFSQTKLDVKSLAAFFCDLDDVSENGYTLAEKRDVLQPLEMHLDHEQSIKNNYPLKWICKNDVQMEIDEVILKLSMDDLYIFNSIIAKQLNDVQLLIQCWNGFSDKGNIDRQKFEESKISLQVSNKDQIIDILNLQAKKTEALIINEQEGGYVPLFFGQCQKLSLHQQSDSEDQTQSTYMQLEVGLDYFHASSGCYEPVVETFPVVLNLSKNGKSSETALKLTQTINFNMTAGLASCLAIFQKLWALSTQNAEKFRKFELDIKQGKTSPQKSSSRRLSSMLLSQEDKKQSLISHKSQSLTAEEQIQKMASPYAIRNLTDKTLQVFSINKQGQVQFSEPDYIKSEETKKLVVAKNDAKAAKSSVGQGTQMDLFVKLVFAEQTMKPVQWLNLNKNNSMILHNVYGSSGSTSKMLPREKYVLHSQLEDNRRVLIVRTLFVMRNETKIPYSVRIFHQDDKTGKVVIDADVRLLPGQSMPLPDHSDQVLQQHIKIAIRPSQCRKWSQEFKLQAMKDRIQPEINVVWQHHETYSILRKEPTLLKGIFDLVLVPPVIIKSCLPFRMIINISGYKKQDPTPKSFLQSSTASLSLSSPENEDVGYTRNVILDRQDEKYLQDIKKQTGELTLQLQLGGQFLNTELCLLPDQAKEGDIQCKITDKRGRKFYIVARVDTKKAGLRIIFFVENVLICRTQQALTFFYQKRAGVFDKDNSNQLAEPVVDEEENVIYVFESTKELYASLQDSSENGFSDKLHIEAGGTIGDFSIITKDRKKSFNYAYQSHLWSVSNTEFISSTIIEVAPQFILCNYSSHELMFQQERAGHALVKLDPNQRQPYHWEDSSKPNRLLFKPMLEQISFSPSFSLKEIGTVIVCCQGGDLKFFFKVTKRMKNQTIFCVIEDSQAPYLIINKLANINLKVVQADEQSQKEIIPVGENCPYSWTNFEAVDPMLSVEFLFGDIQMTPQQQKKGLQLLKQKVIQDMKFSLDDLNEFKTVNMSMDGQYIRVFVSTYRDTHVKVIEFSDSPAAELTEDFEEIKGDEVEETVGRGPNFSGKDKDTITVEISQISISCIKEGHEVIIISLYDIQLKQVATVADTVIETYMARIQIDNNSDLDPLFPVLLRPKCLAGSKDHDHFLKPCRDPVFQFYLHTKSNVPNVKYVELVEFLVKELEVKVELDHIFSMMDWFLSIQEQLNTSLTTMSPVFKRSKKQLDDYQEMEGFIPTHFDPDLITTWRTQDVIQVNETILYIKNYKGSPLLIELSLFKQTGNQEFVDQQRAQKDSSSARGNRIIEKLGNFGIKLTAINCAPVKLEALEMTNVYGNESDISTQLTAHYMQSLKGNIFRVAASSDLIGNPYNVVNSLGRGVKSAYYEPRDGFMKGPLQGGLGIIKGTGGMVAVTGATVVGSIGKVTNTLNKGIVAVSMDRDYIHDKEINDIKNKPKNTIDGFGQGVMGFGTSVFSGVTGVFTKPVEGARTGGVQGFFGGVGKGVAGLVAKPVSGVVDLVSKTTQGVEAHVTGTPDCLQNSQRIRQPRPFYRDLNIVREYDNFHADIYNTLRRQKLTESPFYGAFKCQVFKITDAKTQSYEVKTEVLILTQNTLMALDNQTQQVVWQVSMSDIKSYDFIQEKNSNPKVIFSYRDSKQRIFSRDFTFPQPQQMRECQDHLEEIKHLLQMQAYT